LTRYVRRPSFSHAIVRQLARRTILNPPVLGGSSAGELCNERYPSASLVSSK
jgi:hypothetical protein